MSDLVRIFLISVCMFLCFRLGYYAAWKNGVERVLNETGKAINLAVEKLKSVANDNNFDAPVPDLMGEQMTFDKWTNSQ